MSPLTGGKQITAALYARVITTDQSQDPTTQLLPLEEFLLDSGYPDGGSL